MFSWLMANLATILVSLVLLLIVGLIIRSMIRERKAGVSSCGHGCANCAMHGRCHKAS